MSDNTFITPTTLKGVLQINRPTITDDRGFFRESVRIRAIEETNSIDFHVVQANHARSGRLALRGIHIAPWNKLIYVTRGKVQSVIVDVRPDSETFGKYESFLLGDETKSSIFVPKGMGNAYFVLSEEADYTYLTDEEWAPNREGGLAWDDQTLNIKWETSEFPVLSEKDKHNKTLKELFPKKF
jgi:dTDP-4-dehydrorhamnose 3,5-epimerase